VHTNTLVNQRAGMHCTTLYATTLLHNTQGCSAALVLLTLVGLHFFEQKFMYSWRSRVVVLEIAMGHDLRGIVEAATRTLGDAKVSGCCATVGAC
jgi:hypothetical protein